MKKHEFAEKIKSNPNSPARIIIIRHGTTRSNSEDKMRGWDELPLDEEGKSEAHETGKKLKYKGISALASSDLKRATQMAEIVSKESGIPIVGFSHQFRTWNVGEYTGEDTKKVLPILKKYAADKPDEAIPGGESFNDFKARFIRGIERLKRGYKGKTIGLITHHQGDRIMAAWKRAGEPKDYSVDLPHFFEEGIKPGDFRKEGEQLDFPKEVPR